jgi:hypothetical protein
MRRSTTASVVRSPSPSTSRTASVEPSRPSSVSTSASRRSLSTYSALACRDDLVERRLGDEDAPCLISSGIWRKKNVSSSVRMWLPSTSASVMMMILP